MFAFISHSFVLSWRTAVCCIGCSALFNVCCCMFVLYAFVGLYCMFCTVVLNGFEVFHCLFCTVVLYGFAVLYCMPLQSCILWFCAVVFFGIGLFHIISIMYCRNTCIVFLSTGFYFCIQYTVFLYTFYCITLNYVVLYFIVLRRNSILFPVNFCIL